MESNNSACPGAAIVKNFKGAIYYLDIAYCVFSESGWWYHDPSVKANNINILNISNNFN